ncbi:MAG: cysteine dioxygenase [Phycisphaerales bacterium]|nr:cysteine dioxygenase family protein [Phycisphaeraceae bacterium]
MPPHAVRTKSPKRSAATRTGPRRMHAGSVVATGPGSRFPRLADLIDYLMGLDRRADLATLSRLLRAAKVTREDIAGACIFGSKAYRRNTIASSPWFELLALTWRSGHCTPIHDHQGVSCAFKIIEGTGTEIRFRKTASGLVCPDHVIEMKPGYVCAADDADIHQVANMQAPGTDLITLHIYSPRIKKMNTYPFAASSGPECDAFYDHMRPAGS